MINVFKGQYSFLSNFYPAEFVWDNILWPSSEHAYQAAKCLDRDVRLKVSRLPSPVAAKHAGKTLNIRPDWDRVKIDTMRSIVHAKFAQNLGIQKKLLNTYPLYLEEGNNHGDRFWGISPVESGNGNNWLGIILMEVREHFLTQEVM